MLWSRSGSKPFICVYGWFGVWGNCHCPILEIVTGKSDDFFFFVLYLQLLQMRLLAVISK